MMLANAARRVVAAGSVFAMLVAVVSFFTAQHTAAQEMTSTISIDPPEACVVPFTILPVQGNFTNDTGSSQSASVAVTLSQGMVVIDGCTANIGTCTVVDESTVTWSGTLLNNQTVTIKFRVQAVFSSAQLCLKGVFQLGSEPPMVSQECITTCPRVGAPALGWWQGVLAGFSLLGIGLRRLCSRSA